MTSLEKLVSPHLNQLHQEIKMGNQSAMHTFWQEMSQRGTPLIEPDAQSDNFSLVTFIWQGTATTQHVSVQIAVDGTGQDEHEMTRLLQTDLWFATFCLRNDYRGAYKFIVSNAPDPEQTIETHDRLNEKTFIEPKDEERPDHLEDDIDSVVELPDAARYHWTTPLPKSERGDVKKHLFSSHILSNERRIWVYTPPEYVTSGDPYHLLIVLDGRFFTFAIGVPTILDNLIIGEQIPPFVAIMVDNPGDTWRRSMETREKEMACYPPFSHFLAEELVAWIRKNYHVTQDSRKTFVAGGSFGALAAAFSTLQHPNTFGNLIALSGSFWWKPQDEEEWEWLTQLFAQNPLMPLRIYLEVGLLESKPTQSGFPGQVLANRHLRTVLQAKGYEVHYDEQMHGHDSMTWQGTFAKGIKSLCLNQ